MACNTISLLTRPGASADLSRRSTAGRCKCGTGASPSASGAAGQSAPAIKSAAAASPGMRPFGRFWLEYSKPSRSSACSAPSPIALWHAATISGSSRPSRASVCSKRSACSSRSSPLPACEVIAKHATGIGAAPPWAINRVAKPRPSSCSNALQSAGQPSSTRTRRSAGWPGGAPGPGSKRALQGTSAAKVLASGSCNAASARCTCPGAPSPAHSGRWARVAANRGSSSGARAARSRSLIRAVSTGRPSSSSNSGSSAGRGMPSFAAACNSAAEAPAAHTRCAASN